MAHADQRRAPAPSGTATQPLTTTDWTPAHLSRLLESPATTAPLIRASEVAPMLPGYDVWDLWPVRELDGTTSSIGGGELWVGLSAPALGDPGARHDLARLRLGARRDGGWADLGPVFDDGESLGSREWAGSAVHRPEDRTVTVFYTAAGRRGEEQRTFVQRIAKATVRLVGVGDAIEVTTDGDHGEVVVADGVRYLRAEEDEGEPGFIKAFRDPFFFRDPATGCDHLLFTASLASAATAFNGAIGIAQADGGDWSRWSLGPPVLQADGVNNELERPHVLVHEGLYYLFFSTQRRTFHPDVCGPTGLYGFVGTSLRGPYEPVNGSGLVLQNPPEEPFQAYSWLVLNDMRAVSFVDIHSLRGRRPEDVAVNGAEARKLFGGTIAPVLQLRLDGARAWIEHAADGT